MKTPPIQAALSTREMDTLGILVDLHHEEGRNLAQAAVRETGDPELHNLIIMADALGKRYLIAAGRFNSKGIFATLCDDEQTLIASFQMVNARMGEIGSRTTGWMIKPDACRVLLLEQDTEQRAKKSGGVQ